MLLSVTFGPDRFRQADDELRAAQRQRWRRETPQRRHHPGAPRASCLLVHPGSDQIDLGRTHAVGVRAPEGTFSTHAERGSDRTAFARRGGARPGREACSRRRLRRRCSATRLGGAHPGRRLRVSASISASCTPTMPAAIIAGVECDGAWYRSSATARDRDKLRQAVLEGPRLDDPSCLVDRLVSESARRCRPAP